MNTEFYNQYMLLKSQGLRDRSKEKLLEFIDSFNGFAEKETWVKEYLDKVNNDRNIRHELFKEVIFPVPLVGYTKKDFWSLRMLIRFCQYLYSCDELHKKVDYHTENSLLRLCYDIDPNEKNTKEELLLSILQWFDHCIHEWPSGILYGMDGATLEECDDISSEIGFARTLDNKGKYTEFINDVESKTEQYRNKLAQQIRHLKRSAKS